MENKDVKMSVKEWILTYLLLFVSGIIPFLPILLLIYWAVSSDTNLCKKNWAKAQLVWLAIIVVLVILIFFGLGLSMHDMMNSSYI